MRKLGILLMLCALSVQTWAETVSSLPWSDGEKLVYLIQWGPLEAAEAIFSAQNDPKKDDAQRFELFLRSRGPVEAFFPIRCESFEGSSPSSPILS